MGDVIPMQSLSEQIEHIEDQLAELGTALRDGVQELFDQTLVRNNPLWDKLWALKGRRGDEGFAEDDDAD